MEFRHLEAFLAVADQGSFTRAGLRMHLSQSAVSQLIARLEDELGETLFVRHGGQVRPSEAGARLLPAAAGVLQARQVFLDGANPGLGRPAGRLRVGTIAAATACLWARTYQGFTHAYPDIELDVRATPRTFDTADALIDGMLDVGFLPFPLANPRLTGEILGRHRALLVAARDDPLTRRKRRLRVDDLRKARFILFEDRMNFRRMADDLFRALGTTPNVVLESNDVQLIRAMVEIGMGIALLPDWSIQSELADGRLVELHPPGPDLAEAFGVVHLARGAPALTRYFVRFCRDNTHLLPEVARPPHKPDALANPR